MRVFVQTKKSDLEDDTPLTDIALHMVAEQAARYVARNPKPQSYYDPFNSLGQGVHPIPYGSVQEDPFGYTSETEMEEQGYTSSRLKNFASALGLRRSRSREQFSNESRRRFSRPSSPEFLQPRSSSPYAYNQQNPIAPPYHFSHEEPLSSPYPYNQQNPIPSSYQYPQYQRSSSPDIARRRQRAQLSEYSQNLEKEQRRQQAMMGYPSQFNPQYQQAQQAFYPSMYPNVNFPGYPMMQPQMYGFY